MFKHRLVREVIVVVTIKTLIVLAAAVFVFGPGQRPVINAASVDALFDLPIPAANEESRP